MKIGETIEHNGIKAVLVKGIECNECCFNSLGYDKCPRVNWSSSPSCVTVEKGIFKQLKKEEQNDTRIQ